VREEVRASARVQYCGTDKGRGGRGRGGGGGGRRLGGPLRGSRSLLVGDGLGEAGEGVVRFAWLLLGRPVVTVTRWG
jgi:hypothetical protein